MPRRRPLLLLLLLAAASAASIAASAASIAAVDSGGDTRALLQFKHAVTSDPAGLLSLWSGPGHCSWPGVACDASSRVTALNLSPAAAGGGGGGGGRLSGTLSPALGALSSLRSLNLAGNLFSGAIPRSVSNCKDLTIVNLSQNNLNGTIHDSLISLPFLRRLSLSYNRITGSIPATIGVRLQYLDLAGNLLVGGIPASMGNCSQLRSLVLHSNLLENSIPTDLSRLAKLRVLDISNNAMSGTIPDEIGECKELSVLVLTNDDGDEFNCFQGGLPESVTSLPKLRVLWVPRATVEGEIPGNWGACERLEMVNLGQNLLTGQIPRVFAKCKNLKFLNLSDNKLVGWIDEELPVPCMDLFDVSGNQLSGSIPRFVRRGCASSSYPIDDLASAYYSSFVYKARVATSLPYFEHGGNYGVYHNFGRNNLTGTIQSLPIEVSRFGNLSVYAFLVDGNYLVGSLNEILFEKCKDISGMVANFSDNLVSGEIPAEISTMCRCLLVLDVAGNRITGDIPQDFGSMSSLVGLDLSRNRLQGRIPSSFGELKDLKSLLLAGNYLSGQIPDEVVRIPSLNVLDLSSNSLSGEIPSGLVNLRNLTVLVLSNNKLSGKIPAGVANLTSLSMFNASFNNLSGPLPTNARMTCASVIGNPLLLQSCHAYSFSISPSDLQGRSGDTQTYSNSPPDSAPSSSGTSGFSSIEIASITSAAAIVSVLLALILLYIYTRKCHPRSLAQSSGRKEITIFMDIGVPLTYESVVRATRSYNTSNCIGSGGFGATYKAEVSPGVVVAIKKLSTGRIHGDQQFHAEIKTLGRLRHSNLVTLIGYHLSEEEMFLIYNYLPGGNLERFIQERSKRPVDWRMLHKIALDVASALTYLHEQCAPRILHRDVKPSNILLDNECTAYLSDFGLARLLGNSETHATTGVEGTFGYVAPEYALLCRVSDKADVYSYGVVLMELISDKKVLDPSFSPYRNGFSIVNWANKLLSEGRIPEFFTQGLWDVAPRDDLLHTFRLAIKCTVDTVTDRPTMRQVVRRLKEIQPLAL